MHPPRQQEFLSGKWQLGDTAPHKGIALVVKKSPQYQQDCGFDCRRDGPCGIFVSDIAVRKIRSDTFSHFQIFFDEGIQRMVISDTEVLPRKFK